MSVSHPSTLVLDEIGAGLPVDMEVRRHVEACPRCTAALTSIQHVDAGTRTSVRYANTRAVILAHRREKTVSPRVHWWWVALPTVFAAGLAGVIVIASAVGPVDRLKGSSRLAVVDERGGEVATVVPGQRVRLQVGAAAMPYILVFAQEDSGHIEQLWPEQGPRSVRAPDGARAQLPASFEVTAGSLTVHAFFSPTPLDAARVRLWLQELHVSLPNAVGEHVVHETQRLEVQTAERSGGP